MNTRKSQSNITVNKIQPSIQLAHNENHPEPKVQLQNNIVSAPINKAVTSIYDMQYLINPQRINTADEKNKQSDLLQSDLKFYRLRIFQLTKHFLQTNDTDNDLYDAFENYAKMCINYFKFQDKALTIQQDYENMSESKTKHNIKSAKTDNTTKNAKNAKNTKNIVGNCETKDTEHATAIKIMKIDLDNPENSDDLVDCRQSHKLTESNQLMMKIGKTIVPKITDHIKIQTTKKKSNKKAFIPSRRVFNLKDEKFKELN